MLLWTIISLGGMGYWIHYVRGHRAKYQASLDETLTETRIVEARLRELGEEVL